MLPAAREHTGSVLAQRQLADKSNEIPAFAPLPNTLDLVGTVITAGALHTRHNHGICIRERGTKALQDASHPMEPPSGTPRASVPRGGPGCSLRHTFPGSDKGRRPSRSSGLSSRIPET
ncbi:hypothetical protein SAMN02787118_11433 [Streptomyces mirabilis]|jgi:hypothetical protein|uniref:Uncharacterized protein n=1 Tax=Streptomyces mirabilis TaxID=68239 RepID=A0A1I2N1G2_9ACTN|nr:hypothetical protein SAMN02787118_11433 [Streptomyces mirabilis]